jgi:hypothetical protein
MIGFVSSSRRESATLRSLLLEKISLVKHYRHGPHSRQRLCLSHDPKSLTAASKQESPTQESPTQERIVGRGCCSAAVLASKLTKSLASSVRYPETKHLPNGLQNGLAPQSAARRAARTACVLGKLLSKDEARRIAANIAKLPDLLLGFESRGRA